MVFDPCPFCYEAGLYTSKGHYTCEVCLCDPKICTANGMLGLVGTYFDEGFFEVGDQPLIQDQIITLFNQHFHEVLNILKSYPK